MLNDATAPSRRTIVVGDVHGCWDELCELLDRCARSTGDEVLGVGDLIDRGPDPGAVLRFFRDDPGASSILGNHEDKHLRIRSGELPPGTAQHLCRVQLGDGYDEALDWLATLPLTAERHGCFITHAGVVPGVPLDAQPRQALLRGHMPWMQGLFDHSSAPWWERYRGETPIVYGHSVHPEVHVENLTWGLDTGACHGGALSALVLPERRVVSVPSRGDHYRALRHTHAGDIAREKGRFAAERAAARARAQRSKEAARPRRAIVMLDGEAIDGRWVLDQLGLDPGSAGPWLGALLGALRARVVAEEITSLAAARELVLGWSERGGSRAGADGPVGPE